MKQKTRKRSQRNGRSVARLHFLGATQSVTGSLYVFEFDDEMGQTVRFFVDMGLHQEDEGLNFQNRLIAGVKAEELSFGIFTHAHIDHVGYFPKLYKDGFRGPVYATPATADLLTVLLPDSGHLQEEEAQSRSRRAARKQARTAARTGNKADITAGGSGEGSGKAVRTFPPLYTEAIARESLSLVKPVEFGKSFKPHDLVQVEFKRASHLLGAAVTVVDIGRGSAKRRIVFSGDLGRPGMPILKDLEKVTRADYLLCEGTYGARLHPQRDRMEALADAINRAHERASKPHKKFGHGVILIPAFAVGRVQSVLFDLKRLMSAGRIPEIPVFVDSPMANRATEIYRKHSGEYNREAAKAHASGDLFTTSQFAEITSADESKQLDLNASRPVIILSSSGMASGGRVVHHLKRRLPGGENTVLFIGFQARGTLGRQLTDPAVETVNIGGDELVKRATIEKLEDYSGHADYRDIGKWLSGFEVKPRQLFLVHGDEESLGALEQYVGKILPTWDVKIPHYRESFDLV